MQLPKIYEPALYEADIYTLWDKSRVFVADPASKKPHFSISMPPPNETGTLSLGHALFITLQDIMARYARLQGKDVLWLPGTDHSALPVNAIIEKMLIGEGTDKHAVGRDEFLRRTKEFVADSRGTMLAQMRAMGASCDWSRLRYTLDDTLNRCVNEVFIKMYDDGLIYRGNRIVNWDPNLQTTISDDEVAYQEEVATFYTFQYGPFQISTARPETKFGDKYVVMHPDDKRYADFKHGDTFEAEWINGVVLATVIKDEAVDPTFGTGVMTITPWHDHTDFEIAERHGLDKEQIIDFHGKLMPIAQDLAGLPIAEARPKIVAKLKRKGLLVNEDKQYVHNIALNDRGKGVIEPQVRLQWFVDVNKQAVEWKGKRCSLKEVMQSVVREGDVEIVPERFEKIYFHWIDNLRDWCISRQIWWGHRIPAWYRTDTDGKRETYVGLAPPTDQSEGWNAWEQDPDTLDTWFSSALWTWSTLIDQDLANNPELSLEELLRQSPDYQAYHPTSLMETGWDILFFWVARMILTTTYITGQVPFKTVYLHGMVRATDGKKMSKSRPESIINPLDITREFGTDALRMALIMGVSPGNDQNWSLGKIEANRNFCNKLWNIARYIEAYYDNDALSGNYKFTSLALEQPEPQTTADHWILSMLQRSSSLIANHLDNLRFAEAYDVMYHFVWDDFADWYIEASKAESNKDILAFALVTTLQVCHPFAPFVTETIWQTLTGKVADAEKSEKDAQPKNSLLATSRWPSVSAGDEKLTADFEMVKVAVGEIRDITRALGVREATLYYHNQPPNSDFFERNGALVTKLAKLDAVIAAPTDVNGLHLTLIPHSCWLDVDLQKRTDYLKELKVKHADQAAVIDRLKARLGNAQYIANAPKIVVAETNKHLEEARLLLENISAETKRFAK